MRTGKFILELKSTKNELFYVSNLHAFFAVDLKYIYLSKKGDMKRLLGLLAFVILFFATVSCGTGAFKDEAFYVRGNCAMCKDRLESGVKTIKGVAQAKYNIKDEVLKVTYDTTITNRKVIEQQCANLGHGTKAYPMNEKNHEALPECCKVSHNGGKH